MTGHEGKVDVLQTTIADAVVGAAVLGDVRVRVLTVAETVHHQAVGQLGSAEVDKVRTKAANAVLGYVSQKLRGNCGKTERN